MERTSSARKMFPDMMQALSSWKPETFQAKFGSTKTIMVYRTMRKRTTPMQIGKQLPMLPFGQFSIIGMAQNGNPMEQYLLQQQEKTASIHYQNCQHGFASNKSIMQQVISLLWKISMVIIWQQNIVSAKMLHWIVTLFWIMRH